MRVIKGLRLSQISILIFTLLSGIYVLLAFQNFPAVTVLLGFILLTAAPLGLALRNSAATASEKVQPARIIGGVIFGVWATLIFVTAQVRWNGYYSNFPNARFESGGGFHRDSAFYISVIQNILNSGLPSTGQHFDPILRYHSLSQYADAALIAILGVDAWEAYSLLFVLKSAAFVAAILFFVGEITGKRWVLETFLLLVAPLALTTAWFPTGSEAQWFPFLILVLVSPRLWKSVVLGPPNWSLFVKLTFFILIFSLGKISLGFALAVVSGFLLLIRNPKNFRVYLFGALWLLFFSIWTLVFNDHLTLTRLPWSDLMAFSKDDAVATFAISMMLFILWRITGDRALIPSSLASISSVAIFLLLPVVAVRTSAQDVFYFFHALYTVLALLFFGLLSRVLPRPKELRYLLRKTRVADKGLLAIGLVVVLLGLLEKSPTLVSGSFGNAVGRVSEATSVTYGPINDALSRDFSIFNYSDSAQVKEEYEDFLLSRIKLTVDNAISVNHLAKSDVLLFLSEQEFIYLETLYSGGKGSGETSPGCVDRPQCWHTGLMLKALTGVTLINSLPNDPPQTYGFSSYLQDGHRMELSEFLASSPCRFERPILLLHNLSGTPKAQLLCGK